MAPGFVYVSPVQVRTIAASVWLGLTPVGVASEPDFIGLVVPEPWS